MSEDIVLEGDVEVDSTFVGGRKNRDKTIIFGMIERGARGRAVCYVIGKESEAETLPLIQKYIQQGSIIYSDEGGAFCKLHRYGYAHKTINHSEKIYVQDDRHTCSIDGFWGKFKPAILGTHRHISKKWAQGYINEFCFRHNRNDNEEIIFLDLLNNVAMKLTP